MKSKFKDLYTAISDFYNFGLLFLKSLPSLTIFYMPQFPTFHGCFPKSYQSEFLRLCWSWEQTGKNNYTYFICFSQSKQRFQSSENQVHPWFSSSAEKGLSRVTCVSGMQCRKITCSISNIQISINGFLKKTVLVKTATFRVQLDEV